MGVSSGGVVVRGVPDVSVESQQRTQLSSAGLPPSLKASAGQRDRMPRRSLGADGTGRPSIPEELAIKSRGPGALDAPLSRGMTGIGRFPAADASPLQPRKSGFHRIV